MPTPPSPNRHGRLLAGLALAAALWVTLTRLWTPSPSATPARSAESPRNDPGPDSRSARPAPTAIPRASSRESAEETVARRLRQFVQSRRDLVDGYAASLGIPVPDEFNQLLTLAEEDRWEEMQALYSRLNERRTGGTLPEDSFKLWPAMLETFGVVEATHTWPAQALLDYGNAILGSMPPDAVYVGGTDAGRFIPTFLSETAEGDHPVVLTQNAFADLTYLEYAQFVHGDRLPLLTEDDSRRAFDEYFQDARRRLQHDREHPQEAAQLRPGEQVEVSDDGRVRAGGQVAVMSINELMMKTLMERNPGLQFFMEESYPFRNLYGDAAMAGPLIQLQGPASGGEAPREQAARAVDYWQSVSQRLAGDPGVTGTEAARDSWSKLAIAQAGILEGQKHPAEAERLFGIALELSPVNPEGVFRYASLLQSQGRWQDAMKVARSALDQAPGNEMFRQIIEQLQARAGSPVPTRP